MRRISRFLPSDNVISFEPAVLFAFAVEYGALGVHELLAFAEDAGRDIEAFFHLFKLGGGRLARDLHAVDFQVGLLVDSIACGSRMTAGLTQQCVGPLRVVGEQEQAFARGIEAAHRRYVRYGLAGEHLGVFFAEQVHHGLAALLVACGSDDSARLVHREIELLGGLDWRAVHKDFVVLVGGCFGIAHDFTTQRNSALADQVFCDAPATEAALGYHASNAVRFFPGYLPRYALMFLRHFSFCASVPTVMRSTSPMAGCGRMMVPFICRNLNASIGSLKPLTAMKFAWLST